MEVKKPVRKLTEETVDILCNLCGNSCKTTTDSHLGSSHSFEYVAADVDFGYNSELDGLKAPNGLHFCQLCFVTMLHLCVIEPKLQSFYTDTSVTAVSKPFRMELLVRLGELRAKLDSADAADAS